ncbi:MAG TPA: hypothetical protein VHP11_07775 [Tepidisphaeraceae bacterium]|nr:hypothetical protein [Tepidisphaeraceae bacterium]
MIHFDSPTVAYLFYALAAVAAVLLLYLGYRTGRWMAGLSATKVIGQKEQELFTAQKGFKNLYEQELATLRQQNAALEDRLKTLEGRVEAYRRKAAGFGGLFTSGSRRAEAMYALLLENESLEEALMSQSEKLKQERTDVLREQMRSTSYRRVLLSQLMNDDRIKSYVAELMADEKRLPTPEPPTIHSLPEKTDESH